MTLKRANILPVLSALLLNAYLGFLPAKAAAETLCAEVRLEIKQEATLEREAFDAALEVTNQYPSYGLENFRVNILIKDPAGHSADSLFFVKISSKEAINAVDGTGIVQPASTATVHWLIIPSTGAGGVNPLGLKYSVRADISYKLNGVYQSVSTFDDYITVKPQPSLKLEYVLPFEVFADEPLTTAIEHIEPFPLGVRITNVGYGPARNFQINSGQPEIVENKNGLDIDFKLLGTYVGASKIPDTLLIPFGDVEAGGVSQAAWIMSTTLSGRFVKFDATFSHAAELGGQLTSLIQSVTTYTLVKDVLVDLPGRDGQFDFLVNTTTPRAQMESLLDAGIVPDAILESDQGEPIPVVRLESELTGQLNGANTSATLRFTQNAGAGLWVFASVPAPLDGKAKLVSASRQQDGKVINARNIWISRHFKKQGDSGTYSYRLNLLDYMNTSWPTMPAYTLNFSLESLDTPPAAIADLSAFALSGGQAGLAWTAPGEDGDAGNIIGGKYLIQMETNANAAFVPASAQVTFATNTVAGNSQSYTVSELIGNTTYYARVWLQDSGGAISGLSNGATVYIPPRPPENLSVVGVGSNTATATWMLGNNSLPISYVVRADTDSTLYPGIVSPYFDAITSTGAVAGLTPNTTYFLRAAALNTDTLVYSVYSASVTVLTEAAPPSALNVIVVSSDHFTLAAQNGDNPAYTEYFMQISTLADWAVLAGESGWTGQAGYMFAGLAPETTYYVRAKARNLAGLETAYADLGFVKTRPIDMLPPITTFEVAGSSYQAAGGGLYISSGATLALTATDDVLTDGDKLGSAVISYAVDSDTFTVYSGTFSITAEGPHVVKYYATDAAANAESVKVTSVTVDNLWPTTSLAIEGPQYQGTELVYVSVLSTLTLTALDDYSGLRDITYTLDSDTFPAVSAAAVRITTEGVHTLSYQSTDNLGHIEPVRLSTITVDATGPLFAFEVYGSTAAGDGVVYAAAGSTAEFTASDAMSGVKRISYELDGSTGDVAASSYTYAAGPGTHSLLFSAADNVDNISQPAAYYLCIDTEPPVTEAFATGAAGGNGWYVSSVTVTLVSTDSLSGFAGAYYQIEAGGQRSELTEYTAPFTLSEDGSYTVYYRAKDRVGNLETERSLPVKIDISSPAVTVVSTPAANTYGWNAGPVGIIFVGTDAVSGVVECSSGTISMEGAGQSLAGWCRDAAGNIGYATATVNIDLTPPTASAAQVPGPNEAGWNSAPVDVVFTGTDAVSGIAYCLPAGGLGGGATVTISVEGASQTISGYCMDYAGWSSTASSTVNIDTTPPSSTASVDAVAGLNGWYMSPAALILTSTDSLSGVETLFYSVDGSSFALYSSSIVFTDAGTHSARYYAADRAGNAEPEHELTLKIYADQLLVTAIPTPPANAAGWNNGPVNVVFAGTDPVSGIAYCSPDVLVSSEGANQTVSGWCMNYAGVSSTATLTLNIDLSTPVVAISSPMAGMYIAGRDKVNIWYTVADNLDTAPVVTAWLTEVEDRGSPRGDLPRNVAVVNGQMLDPVDIDDGVWRLMVGATDFADNARVVSSGTFEVVHENLSPRTALTVGSPLFTSGGVTYITSGTVLQLASIDDLAVPGDGLGLGVKKQFALLRASDSVEVSTIEFQDPSPAQGGTFSSTFTLAGQADGLYFLAYYAEDTAGNKETVKLSTLAVDNTPAGTVWTATDGLWAMSEGLLFLGTTAVMELHGVDVSSNGVASGLYRTSYRLDDGQWRIYIGTTPIAGLTAGPHTLKYYTVDMLGNQEPVRTMHIRVDAAPPESSALLSGDAGGEGWYVSPVGAVLSSTDPVSGVKDIYYSSDSASFTVYAPPLVIADEGAHTLAYYAADRVGNIELAKGVSAKIDLNPPDTTAVPAPAANAAGWNDTAVSVVFIGTDTASGIAYCSTGAAVAAEGAGQAVRGYCMDRAGWSSTATYVVNLDITPPEAQAWALGAPIDDNSSVYLTTGDAVILISTDALSGIAAAAYAIDAVFSTQTAAAYQVPFTLEPGTRAVSYAAADKAGNWSGIRSFVAYVPLPTLVAESTDTVLGMSFQSALLNGATTSVSIAAVSTTTERVALALSSAAGQEILLVSVIYELGPEGTVFDPPALLTFQYSTASLAAAGISESDIAIYQHFPDIGWVRLSTQTVDMVNHTITAYISQIASLFSVFGDLSDRTAPVTDLAAVGDSWAAPDALFINARSSITFNAYDPVVYGTSSGVAFTEFRVDTDTSAPFAAYSASFMLSTGSHYVEFRSQDNAGNLEAVKSRVVYVDAAPPVTALVFSSTVYQSPDGTLAISTDTYIGFSADDPAENGAAAGVAAIFYTVDSGAVTVFTSTFTVSRGIHAITYWSADKAGNIEAARQAAIRSALEPAITVSLDIDPDTLNLKSKGEVITATLLAEGKNNICFNGPSVRIYAINDIILSTPIYAVHKDKGSPAEQCGGITLKFDRAAVSAVLPAGARVKITVAGFLGNGDMFTATDFIRTIHPITVSAAQTAGADPAFKLGEVYVFPNPAKGGAVPTFHIECGIADSVKITVYTVSGRMAHERTITGAPAAMDDGNGLNYAYEYVWDGHIPSGVYYYFVEAGKAGQKLKKTGKFIVIR